MFTPKYKLSEKLLANISFIERLYGRLEALRIPKKLELNLQRTNMVQSTYVSNSIEGNPLSLAEVTNVLLGDRVAVNRDEKEVKNYFDLLKHLNDCINKKMNIELLLTLHKKLLYGVQDDITGQIRDKKVVVGKHIDGQLFQTKHTPPFHTAPEIKKAMEELFEWEEQAQIPPTLKAGIFHHEFVFIHPFVDGNGRVCRLLTSLIFLKNNYSINKYFVLDDYYDIDRIMYSDKLHTADYGDKTEWLEYFTDGVKYSLQSAYEKYKNAMTTLKAEERLTPKEQEVLKILQDKTEATSSELTEKLKVSRQQAHSLLKSLVDKGFLGKKGSTKNSFYFLK